MLTSDELFRELTTEIVARFSYVKYGFEGKAYPDRTILMVHVLDATDLEKLTAFCKELEGRKFDTDKPIEIVVDRWTKPWPGGITVEELRERRDKFVQMVRSRQLPA